RRMAPGARAKVVRGSSGRMRVCCESTITQRIGQPAKKHKKQASHKKAQKAQKKNLLDQKDHRINQESALIILSLLCLFVANQGLNV
ncbi:MAG TPA: hypothetical protein VJ063_08555, partial [Verrucomicrobiae bacterium]|nr:hypothetical protein [Verrucomicrobiae bacterium]